MRQPRWLVPSLTLALCCAACSSSAGGGGGALGTLQAHFEAANPPSGSAPPAVGGLAASEQGASGAAAVTPSAALAAPGAAIGASGTLPKDAATGAAAVVPIGDYGSGGGGNVGGGNTETATLAPVPTATGSPAPTPTPSASATPTPTPTPSASTASASPTPTPTPTPTPSAAANSGSLGQLATTYGAHLTMLGSGLRGPNGLAITSDDTLYESDWNGNTVTKVTQSGTCTTYAAGFGGPAGLAFDHAGNLLVACYNSNKLEVVPPGGGSHHAIVSTGLNRPVWPVVNSRGDTYLADYSNNRLALVKADGSVSTFATIGGVNAVVLDPQGNLYITTWGGQVAQMTPDGHQTTLASGLSTACGLDWCSDYLAVVTYGGQNAHNGRLVLVDFNGHQAEVANGLDRASSVVFDHHRNLYTANVGDSALRKYTLP